MARKDPGVLTPEQMQAMMAASQKRLEAEAPNAPKFEFGNWDPSGSGDFILIGTTSPILLTKTSMRIGQAQMLGIIAHFASGLAMAMANPAPPNGHQA